MTVTITIEPRQAMLNERRLPILNQRRRQHRRGPTVVTRPVSDCWAHASAASIVTVRDPWASR